MLGNVINSLSEIAAQVSSLLESLPNLFAQTQLADACAGAAAQACIDTLKVRPKLTRALL